MAVKPSFLLTESIAQEAIGMVYPMFQAAAQKKQVKRDQLHIVVMNPCLTYDSGASFQDAILVEAGWGNPPEKYQAIAFQKAEVSWRTGLPSLIVQQVYPYLLTASNTKWGGSWVHQGIVVACSGVEEFMDQLFSQIIGATCAACSTRFIRQALADETITFMADCLKPLDK